MQQLNKRGRSTVFHKFFVVSIFLVLSIITTAPASAYTSADFQSIYYNTYQLDEEGNVCASSAIHNKGTDYKNGQVFNDKQLEAINENKAVYEKVAKEVDIPWQMLAVIHIRESGGRRANPGNGQGIYQFYDKHGGPYPAGAVDDAEFLRQTILAAKFVKGKAKSNYSGNQDLTASSNAATIKDTFFSYNGRAGVYKEQAKRLGFGDSEGYEGSPYVMNMADAKRDPTAAANGTWGQIKRDGGSIEYPANLGYGAFVMYGALGGEVGTTDCGTGSVIAEGGLTLEQAKAFMMRYGENVNGFSAKQSGSLWGYCGGGGSNCVTFSYFFNHTFTDLPAATGDGNGVAIVNSLRGKGASGGNTPRVFATFSWDNHTGIVLGIHGDQIIVGHASCQRGKAGIRGKGDGTLSGGGSGFVITGSLKDNKAFRNKTPTGFAYPDKVDTAAIQEFIDKGYVTNTIKT